GSQVSVEQACPSLQLTAVPQAPATQTLPVVQAFWSSHGSPSGSGVCTHWPFAAAQTSCVQGFLSSQSASVRQTSSGVADMPTPASFRQTVIAEASPMTREA